MRPITRETITDRRQPALRWSAVLAGAVSAVALWVLLQMFGMGVGLAAIDLDDAGSLRSVGIGTTMWTLLAPLLALFAGGYVAGRLAATFERKVGATHGFVTWAIASLAGMFATVALVGMLAGGSLRSPTRSFATEDIRIEPGLRAAEIQRATESAGALLLGGSISLLLGLGAAIAGGALAAHRPRRRRQHTAEVPVVPPPADPPRDAPHVTA